MGPPWKLPFLKTAHSYSFLLSPATHAICYTALSASFIPLAILHVARNNLPCVSERKRILHTFDNAWWNSDDIPYRNIEIILTKVSTDRYLWWKLVRQMYICILRIVTSHNVLITPCKFWQVEGIIISKEMRDKNMDEIWRYADEWIEYRLTFFRILGMNVMHDHELHNELHLLNILTTYVYGIALAARQCLHLVIAAVCRSLVW